MYILFRKITCPWKHGEHRSHGALSRPGSRAPWAQLDSQPTKSACGRHSAGSSSEGRTDLATASGGPSPGSAGLGCCPSLLSPRVAAVMSPAYHRAPAQRRFLPLGCHGNGDVGAGVARQDCRAPSENLLGMVPSDLRASSGCSSGNPSTFFILGAPGIMDLTPTPHVGLACLKPAQHFVLRGHFMSSTLFHFECERLSLGCPLVLFE